MGPLTTKGYPCKANAQRVVGGEGVNHTFLGKVYGKLMCPDGGFLLVVCGIWRVSTNK